MTHWCWRASCPRCWAARSRPWISGRTRRSTPWRTVCSIPTPGRLQAACGASAGAASLDEPIAVIGLGCRLPGDIHGPEAFWQFLAEGRSTVGEVPDERWQGFDDGSAEVGAALARTTRWGSFLDDVAAFDAEYFDISPSEAERIDPQQRLLLEVAVEALDHAGIPAESLRRTQTGVFAGACVSEYSVLGSRDLGRIDAWTWTGGALSIIANRLSYFLDLRGPSVTVDTACSSSLVAIHLACKSLRTGESDLALAAGSTLSCLRRSPAASTRPGRCRRAAAAARSMPGPTGSSAARAAESSCSSGSRSMRDGNRVLAVVRGSAINQDGRSNGLMAPNPAAQAAVLRAACAAAGVEPREVDYVEAHGTGTLLGDPIEARGLGSVYGRGRAPAPAADRLGQDQRRSPRGRRRRNRVHQGDTGGSARPDPGQPALRPPNPHIPFEELGLRVVDEPTNWPSTGRPRRAAVSSFGFGGTNAHLVLEQRPAPASPQLHPADAPVTTLVVAGKTPQRVARWAGVSPNGWTGRRRRAAGRHRAHRQPPPQSARQLRNGRRTHREQAVAGLRALAAGQSALRCGGTASGPCSPGVVFVYSGQGSQWAGMGQTASGRRARLRRSRR